MEADHAASAPQAAAALAPPPAVDDLSERAMAAAKAADRLVGLSIIELRSLDDQRIVFVSAGYALACGGACIALAEAVGAMPLLMAQPLTGVVAGLFGGTALCLGLTTARAAADRQRAVSIQGHLVSARHCGIAARRVDTVLAGFYGRGEPRAEDRRMMASLLNLIERDLAILGQKSTAASAETPTGLRRHERIVPRRTKTTILASDGRTFSARIIDLSLSGVAIETELPDLPVGADVFVGNRPARAVRKLKRGMAFEFKEPLESATFGPDVVL